MKKKLFIILIFGAILIVSISILFMFIGTPWGKATAQKQAQEYLEKTYKQKMIAEHATYDFITEDYLVQASPISNSNFKFILYLSNGSVWKDKYYLEYFSYELAKGANQLIKDLFGQKNRAYVTIDSEDINEFNIKDLNENTKIEDIEKCFEGEYSIGIIIFRGFNASNCQKNAEKMFKLIRYVNTLDSKPNRICFSYYKEGRTSSSNLDYRLSLDQEEYQYIVSINDLFSYLNKKDNITK